MFPEFRKFETTLAGRPLVVETGKMAGLAGGSCLIRYGETEVLCTATMAAKPREGVDFFPLSVDFEEKLYSVGRIPGSFQRREGKASEKATLSSRVIDRPIRLNVAGCSRTHLVSGRINIYFKKILFKTFHQGKSSFNFITASVNASFASLYL